MNIDTIFANKVIVRNIKPTEIKPLVKKFIETTWTSIKVPEDRRMAGNKNFTLKQLPANIDIDKIVDDAINKTFIKMQKFGVIEVCLDARIVANTDVNNPLYSFEVDKFTFEGNGCDALQIMKQCIGTEKKK
jgi:hypothetical protein